MVSSPLQQRSGSVQHWRREEARCGVRMQGFVHAFIHQAQTYICSCIQPIYTILLGYFYFLLHYKARISDQKQRNLVISCQKQDGDRSTAINCTVHKKFQHINESTAEQTTGNDKAEHNYWKKYIKILGYSQLRNIADLRFSLLHEIISPVKSGKAEASMNLATNPTQFVFRNAWRFYIASEYAADTSPGPITVTEEIAANGPW